MTSRVVQPPLPTRQALLVPFDPTTPPNRGKHRTDEHRAKTLRQTAIAAALVTVGALGATFGPGLFSGGGSSGPTLGVSSATSSQAAGSTVARTSPSTTAPSTAPITAAAAQPTQSGCASGTPISVGVSSELAAIVQRAVAAGPDSTCTAVSGVQPQDVLGATNAPDVWITESSMWAPGGPNTVGVSVASSPVVLALTTTTADQLTASGAPLTFATLLSSRATATPVRIGLPDPHVYAPSADVLLAAGSMATGETADRASVTWALRSTPADLPTDQAALLALAAQNPNLAVPVSAQALAAFDAASPGVLTGVPGSLQLDYRAVVLNAALPADRVSALVTALKTPAVAGQLARAGFAAPLADGAAAVDPTAMTAALADWAAVNQASRLLAVLDVSGSMGADVPGAPGATRMSLAKAAASRGLGLYGTDSDIGLWLFSRNLTATTDYREVVPVGPLGAVTDGLTGQQRIGSALSVADVNIDGGTGLYDTTLAAVRTMRANWDPSKVNLVLILSDGQNDDEGSISLDALLATLQAEQDPARPIPVLAIAFGPDSDISAMSQISAVTGGAVYIAKDPRDIGDIFLDAVGQRLCRPNC